MEEIRQGCQDALDDAVLMGCDERQFREALLELIAGLQGEDVRGEVAIVVEGLPSGAGNLTAAVWSASVWSGPIKVANASMGSGPTAGVDAAGHAWAYWQGTDTKAWGAYFDGKAWIGPVTIPQMGPFG